MAEPSGPEYVLGHLWWRGLSPRPACQVRICMSYSRYNSNFEHDDNTLLALRIKHS